MKIRPNKKQRLPVPEVGFHDAPFQSPKCNSDRSASSRVNATSLSRSVSHAQLHPLWSRKVRCRVLSKAHPVLGQLSSTNRAHAFDRAPRRTPRTLLARRSLVPRRSVVWQSRPSTVALHKFLGRRFWLCPGPKPVPPTNRADRMVDLVVNEYSTFVYPRWQSPKGNYLCPKWNALKTRRHFLHPCCTNRRR
jgi:hypothetical protein